MSADATATFEAVLEPGLERFPHLHKPLLLGRLTLRDRFAMAPMTTNFAGPDGQVTPELIDYLALRGAGGFSLVITENMGVHGTGRVMPRMLMAHEDHLVVGLRRLASTVQATGAAIFAQLSHCGRQSRPKFTGNQLVAPSAIPCPLNREMPRALDLDEIATMVRAFVDAAARVEAAGYDGVEVHAAHGYLPSGFLSAYSNKREDRYGGSLENRMRFLLEIVDGIKRRTRLPLSVRISGDELVEGGNTVAETTEIARALEEHGVDAISVSVGVYESFNAMSMVTGEKEGRWLPLAGMIKQHVSIPVMGVGRIKRPEVAEAAVAADHCDIPLFGRAAIADPELPRKVTRGETRRIMWCLSCNLCLGRAARPETICPVNPGVGRDAALTHDIAQRAPSPRRIAIAGSGLAALTAAWIAAARGHSVTVHDERSELGGMARWRARVPGQSEYNETIAAFAERARDVGALFSKLAPRTGDHDILWVSRHFQPGRTRDLDVYEVLAIEPLPGSGDVVTVIGQDLASAECALRLANAGNSVTLCSPGGDIALDAHPGYRMLVRRLLEGAGATIKLGTLPETHEIAGRAVRGHPIAAPTAYGDEHGWTNPHGDVADAWIDDAYEPGLMTRAIYSAVELARRA